MANIVGSRVNDRGICTVTLGDDSFEIVSNLQALAQDSFIQKTSSDLLGLFRQVQREQASPK